MHRTYPTLRTFSIFFISLLLSACVGYHSNVGKTALKNDTLPLQPNITDSQDWQTEDIEVRYNVIKAGNAFTIAGNLYLKDRIYYSFPAAEYFYFYINYLDDENRVLSSHDISPLIPYRTHYQDNFKLRSAPPSPDGATSFVFSYWGNFTAPSYDNENSGDWEIYYSPFETYN